MKDSLAHRWFTTTVMAAAVVLAAVGMSADADDKAPAIRIGVFHLEGDQMQGGCSWRPRSQAGTNSQPAKTRKLCATRGSPTARLVRDGAIA